MKKKSVQINGKTVLAEDVQEIRNNILISDEYFCEIRYRAHEPHYHEVCTLVSKEKGLEIEKEVNKQH